jgi:hypothetical protein
MRCSNYNGDFVIHESAKKIEKLNVNAPLRQEHITIIKLHYE